MMESIEKLRKSLKDCTNEAGVEPNRFDTYWITARACDMLIDEIEAEIERDYMKLPEGWTTEQASEIIGYWPKWDDGKPCMFGDRFTTPKYAFEENAETFDRLVIYARDHVFKHADGTTYEGEHGGYYEWNYFRPGGDGCEEYRPHHVKPRTIEDVLHDVVSLCFNTWKKPSAFSSCDVDDVMASGNMDDFAKELREMMEVGE